MTNNPHDSDLEGRIEVWASAQTPPDLPAGARRAIRTRLEVSLKPVKPIASQRKLALRLGLMFVLCASLLIASMDKVGFRLMSAAQMLGMAAILLAGAVLFSLSLASQMVPGSRNVFLFHRVLAFMSITTIGATVLLFPWRVPGAFVAEGWMCALREVMVAVPALYLFWLFARRGALFASSRLGAALGGLAVYLALLVMQFQCMFQQAPHLLVWHHGVAAAVIGIAAWMGTRRSSGRMPSRPEI
jgi:hypothetical protein